MKSKRLSETNGKSTGQVAAPQKKQKNRYFQPLIVQGALYN